MERRHCRWIVLSDAGQNGAYDFADPGNTARKIWIDLGVRIDFPTPKLFAEQQSPHWERPRFAVGTITCPEPDADSGQILRIKLVVRYDVPADIVAYCRERPEFPQRRPLTRRSTKRGLRAVARLASGR